MGGKNSGEKPEEESPSVESMCMSVHVELQRSLSRAVGTSFLCYGVSTMLDRGWGVAGLHRPQPRLFMTDFPSVCV